MVHVSFDVQIITLFQVFVIHGNRNDLMLAESDTCHGNDPKRTIICIKHVFISTGTGLCALFLT